MIRLRRHSLAVMPTLLAIVLAMPAAGQSTRPKPEALPPAAPAPLESGAPPYEVPLQRLAELLGTLSYLRDLCGNADGSEFRARMSTLLDAEAAVGPRRERIAGYFNRGWREYELLHRTCTPVSRLVVQRSMDEAGRLARELGSRFGGT